MLMARWAIAGIVLLGIVGTFWKMSDQWAQQPLDVGRLDWRWLLLSALLYGVGMLPLGYFWWITMRAFGQRPSVAAALRAYYIGNLGKYVPGKVMVLVLRTELVRRGAEVNRTLAAVSILVETLTMMASGSFLAGLLLLLDKTSGDWLRWLSLACLLVTFIPSIPIVFRRVIWLMQVHRAESGVQVALRGLSTRLIIQGWLLGIAGWLFMGASLWATVCAIPGTEVALNWRSLGNMTSANCLAVVAGFVSMLPGGFGARDLVVHWLLTPNLGEVTAFLAMLVHRVITLVTEVVISAILYPAIRTRPPADIPL